MEWNTPGKKDKNPAPDYPWFLRTILIAPHNFISLIVTVHQIKIVPLIVMDGWMDGLEQPQERAGSKNGNQKSGAIVLKCEKTKKPSSPWPVYTYGMGGSNACVVCDDQFNHWCQLTPTNQDTIPYSCSAQTKMTPLKIVVSLCYLLFWHQRPFILALRLVMT
jgi:hypothetical protein